MSNPIFAAIYAVSLAAVLCASAAPVSEDEAATAVEHWLKSGQTMGCTGMGDVAGVQSYDGKESVGKFYVISLKNGAGEAAGYVVTSADRKLNPILAFSDDGTFEATEKNPLWVMLTIDVSAITKDLEATEAVQSTASSGRRLLAAAPTENERKWAELLEDAGGSNNRLRASALYYVSDVRVAPLLKTKWNQDYDSYYYKKTWNLMTPSNYVCGCVATAAAQIMKYWEWPDASANITAKTDYTGKVVVGSVTNIWRLSDFTTGVNEYKPAFGGTYLWSEMADEYDYKSSDASRLAVAKLVRDIGMSVHMTYEYDGSGAMNPVMAVRFTDQFAYANAMCRYPKENTNWDTERDNTIRANLNAGLPLGVSVPGHAIIADGYGYETSSGTFYVHFNMGWGGSKDYWYNPPDLTASGHSAFNSIRCLIFNIYPPTKCAESGRSVVSGRVLDSFGTPVAGVTVEAKKGTATSATTTSNDKGIYAFLLPKGQYTFRAATDYASATTNINVKACTTNGIVPDESAYYNGGDSTGNISGVELTLTQMEQAAAPTANCTTGYRNTLVDLASTVPGAVIRYTTDGSDPTTDSPIYTSGTTIINITDRTGPTTIKARVYADGYRPSEVITTNCYVKQFFGPTNGPNAAVWEDTPQNRADHWIFENEDYKEATGVWSDAVEYVDHKVMIEGDNEFIVDNPSAGRNVTVEVAVTLDSEAEEDRDIDDAKAAVRLGTNSCLQVYTKNNGDRVWLDTEDFEVTLGEEHTVRFELDMTNKTYSVSVKQDGGYVPLTVAGKSIFPFANDGTEPSVVQAVCFQGTGFVESIYGSYTNKVAEFVVNDVVTGSDGTNVTLSAAQARWLNDMRSYDAVCAKISGMTSSELEEAWLLNLDLTAEKPALVSFKIVDIEVTDEKVKVNVELTRTGTMNPRKINGTLYIHRYTELGSEPTKERVDDIDFSDGDTAEHSFTRDANDRFFRAVIAAPENN